MTLISNKKIALITLFSICIGQLVEHQIANPTNEEIATEFSLALEAKLEKLSETMVAAESNPGFSFSDTLSPADSFSLRNKGISVYHYVDDTLRYWSDHTIPIANMLSESNLQQGLLRLNNGWYYAINRPKDNETWVGLVKIKTQYPFENRFLVSDFQTGFNVPKAWGLHKDPATKSEPVNLKNKYAFSLLPGTITINDKFDFSPFGYCAMVFFYFLSFVFFIVLLQRSLTQSTLINSKIIQSGLLVFVLVGLRMLMQSLQIPTSLYELPLFSPSIYGSSIISPSLGDLFINTSLCLYFSLYIKPELSGFKFMLPKESPLVFVGKTILVCLGLLLSLFVFSVFSELVLNSKIPFNINNLFELTFYSLIGLVSMAMLLFIYYIIARHIIATLNNDRWKSKTLIFLFSCLAFIGSGMLIFNQDIDQLIWPILLYGILLYGYLPFFRHPESTDRTSLPFYQTVLLIALFAFVSSRQISHDLMVRESAHRIALAEKLSAETDPVAEFLFLEVSAEIEQDTIISNTPANSPIPKDKIKTHIIENYFSGYWEKYDIQLTICGDNDSLNIQPEDIVVSCKDFFSRAIADYGTATVANNFFFLDNNNGRISYLGRFNLGVCWGFVELDSKLIPENLGFPELLLDANSSTKLRNDLKLYSYAKYKDGILTERSGKYQYDTKQPVISGSVTNQFISKDGHSHLAYHIDETALILLSKPELSLTDSLVSGSYIFTLFCILAILYALTKTAFLQSFNLTFNFRKKIELSMFFLLLVSFIPIGLGTKYYVELQHNKRNHEQLKEKMQSVLVEIEHKLDDEKELSENLGEYLSYLLTKFSYVFFTDLSLYSTDGSLIASSRKEIFNNGLIGGKMNPVAFNALSKKEKPDFIQNENIGDLFFLSAYVPFRNRDNKLLAYLNLPYFAKEGELRKEISTLLVALINFYLMLIVVSIGIALFLSNKITQPLRIIQDKIAQIKIGQPNEPIEWKGNDELGGLVAEYNRMLDELSISAERLAQSERESAWREMAKQVAHEIKNPLTPMKLSVQHLERAWNEKSTDWDDRLKRFSKTLINQIDALAKIAEEFSAFAKMPKADQKVIDLDNLIQSIIPLFQETENLSLVYRPFKSAAKPSVFVDKEQIVRVLNNLIKNSVDATSEKDNRKIIIALSERQNQFIVMVKDNGCGIDAKEKNKIFTPKFTTKSSGMGLGLAIVKNIISNSDGDVWFDSEIGVGSSFYFSLPKHSG